MGHTTYAIGELARLSGLPVKTIRFYSDSGLLPPSDRTDAGHRRYDETDLVRLQLIRSLRDLDLDLPTIRVVLEARADLGAVLQAHLRVLETRIRGLQRQLAVLRAAAGAPSESTVRRVLRLARLDALERRALLAHFWDRATEGSPLDAADLEPMRRAGMPDLPDDPSAEQLDAWLELAELATDEDFVRSVRGSATWMAEAAPGRHVDGRRLQAEASAAMGEAVRMMEDGIGPDRAEAAAVLTRLVRPYARALGRRDSARFRRWLLERFDAMYDPRAEHYWQLVATIRGEEWPDPAGRRLAADGFRWLMEALRHEVASRPERRGRRRSPAGT